MAFTRSASSPVSWRAGGSGGLPTGNVTFLMTDIEGSTALLLQLGDRYASLLADARRIARTFVDLGEQHLRGLGAHALFEVSAPDLSAGMYAQRT